MIALAILVGIVLGVASAAFVVFFPPFRPVIRNGAWMTNLKVGSRDAGMYLRAFIALTGLFALNKRETIYYRASTDESGQPIRADRDYVISGVDIPGRWWAIIVYGRDHHLIANPAGRYSFNMGNLEREADGSFRIALSRTPKPRNWLPSGMKDQTLSFSLKIYNPAPEVYERPDRIALPRITAVPR
jgi:hypothetical protein